MAARKRRRTQKVEFAQQQKRAAGDRYAGSSNPDLDESTISEEMIDRAMRVYAPGEAMDLLICGVPGRSESTERWQDFLVLMRRTPPTRATQRGIQEAERELAYRRSRYADPADEAYLSFLPFQQLIEHFTPIEKDVACIHDDPLGGDDEA